MEIVARMLEMKTAVALTQECSKTRELVAGGHMNRARAVGYAVEVVKLMVDHCCCPGVAGAVVGFAVVDSVDFAAETVDDVEGSDLASSDSDVVHHLPIWELRMEGD